VVLDRLDDDDGVVDDDADGQDEPKRVRLLSEKPEAAMAAKVPTMATGTATRGMTAERQFWRKSRTTTATRMMASRSVLNTSLIDSRMNGVVS
jgi:hypothetical protein